MLAQNACAKLPAEGKAGWSTRSAAGELVGRAELRVNRGARRRRPILWGASPNCCSAGTLWLFELLEGDCGQSETVAPLHVCLGSLASSLVETVRSPKINASSTYDDWGVGTGLAVVEGRARVELKLARVTVRPGAGRGRLSYRTYWWNIEV